MADECTSLVRGKMIRATELDECGAVVVGAGDWPVNVVSKGFISVAYTNEIDDGEEIDQKDANGDSCVAEPPCPRIKWVNVTIVLCKVDPALFTLMTKWPLVIDEDGNAIGFRWQNRIECAAGFGLEVWTGTKKAGQCVVGDAPLGLRTKFGYLLAQYVTQAYVSDLTIENGAANFTIVGKALDTGLWDVGPYDIQVISTGLSPLADPMAEGEPMHFQVTTLPPPDEICGLYPRPFESTITVSDAPTHEMNLQHTFVPSAHANTIDWGDGSTSVGPTIVGAPGVDHAYAAAGDYLVTVTDTVSGAISRTLITVP